MSEKVKAVSFKIDWSESGLADSLTTFTSWADFGYAIRTIAQHAPIGGAYDKTGFTVTFADDSTYNGRLDIQHHTMSYPGNDNDLAQHILSICRFYTGELCPSHMTEEVYRDTITRAGNLVVQGYIDFLATYEIPESDGVIDVGKLITCIGCHQSFVKTGGNRFCGRCLSDQEEKDRKHRERQEAQEAREADPLWPIYKEGRTAVTKKMRQLLRQRSGKNWSVRGGRGTGWGWLDISSPPSRQDNWRMTEEDRRELAALLGKDSVHCQGELVSPENWWPYLVACRG